MDVMRGPNQKKIPIARRLRRESTSAESRLWAELRNRQLGGFKFVRQSPITGYVVDFVCREAMLIIEVDGATHSTNEELKRDAKRSALLEELGYAIVRVQNDDVYNAMEGVLQSIGAALEESRK
jgi:very-short-patch-repair endonuclease